jgi:bacterioferritin-associated ferredoxin
MVLCHCRAVSDHDVRAVIAGGAQTPTQIADRCGAGGDCGSCRPLVEDLLDQAGLVAVTIGA